MSSNATPSSPAQEPEEILEAKLCTILASSCALPIEGALTPSTAGTVKNLTADSFISVKVDLTAQDADLTNPATFVTFSAAVSVHYAMADDPTGSAHRDECRAVRAALRALTGDGCAALTTAAIACDGFTLDATSTDFEAGDNPTNTKTYTATLKCRTLTTEGASNG